MLRMGALAVGVIVAWSIILAVDPLWRHRPPYVLGVIAGCIGSAAAIGWLGVVSQ